MAATSTGRPIDGTENGALARNPNRRPIKAKRCPRPHPLPHPATTPPSPPSPLRSRLAVSRAAADSDTTLPRALTSPSCDHDTVLSEEQLGSPHRQKPRLHRSQPWSLTSTPRSRSARTKSHRHGHDAGTPRRATSPSDVSAISLHPRSHRSTRASPRCAPPHAAPVPPSS
jgi:hypothetical protein